MSAVESGPDLSSMRPDHAFPPGARLHDNRDYSRVMHRQQKAAGRHVVVLLRPRDRREPDRPRVGIMVSTKVAKRAVRRHQLKRWVREWFRTIAAPQLPAVDVVVLFRSDPPAAAHAAFIDELEHALTKAVAAKPQPDQRRR